MNETIKTFEDLSSFQEDLSDYNDSSDGLEIDISESPKRKDKINIEDKHVLENIEEEIERQYDEKAAKSNLSAINVKNILRHVITNEHVWAMVRNTEEGNVDTETIYEPKLTRAKTKELLQTKKLAASIPWMKPKPTSEVHDILINDELPEDSDDDEYIPHEEESETETCNTNESDYSQPTTPATPNLTQDTSTQTIWTEDGIFKIPSTPPAPEDLTNDANIWLRTRSKLSLSNTPLEVIEEALIPPDITTDMYDLECDDEDWKDFLKKFTRPLDEAVQGTQEDDDEADPEYNVLADEEIDKLDKEELRQDRAVKISKKELNNLVAELFEFSEMFSNTKDFIETTETTTVDEIQNNEINQQPVVVSTAEPSTSVYINTQPVLISQPVKVQVSMLPDQTLLFEQQMRQHVQMLTQNFVLTYQHPWIGDLANTFKDMVLSFYELSKYKLTSAFKPCNLIGAVQFIDEWQKIVETNSPEVQEMKKQIANAFNENRLKKRAAVRKQESIIKFPKLILQKICQSSVFMYPSLLPETPFKWQRKNNKIRMPKYSPSEDELIAIGLEQFFLELERDEKYRARWGKPRIPDVAYFIAKYMIPIADQRKICGRIRQLKEKRAIPNPIKYFFENRVAPRTVHYVENLSKLGMLPPFMRPSALLPGQWKVFLYPGFQQFDFSLKRPKKVQKPPAYNKGLPTKKQRLIIPKSPNNSHINQVFIITHDSFPPTTDTRQSPSILTKENVNDVLEGADSFSSTTDPLQIPSILTKENVIADDVVLGDADTHISNKQQSSNFVNNKNNGPTFEEVYYDSIELVPESKPLIVTEDNINKSICENTINPDIDSSTDTKETDIPQSNKVTDFYLGNNEDIEDLIPENIISKIQIKKKNTKKQLIKTSKSLDLNKLSPILLKFKFNSSIFSKFKKRNMLPSMPFLLTPQKNIIQKDLELSNESLDDKSPSNDSPSLNEDNQISLSSEVKQKFNEDNQQPLIIQSKNDISEIVEIIEVENDLKKDDEDELNALMVASTTIQQKNKRIQSTLTKRAKQMKQYNATLAMLCPEDSNHVEEKAKNYAQAYYDKVQERLECESPIEYQRFMEALSEHDESSGTVSELYEKVSSVLSPKHPDLCEEFLSFLTAEQAQQIGKLVPHFMMSNMSLFLRKLEIYYNNQPAQLRRIYNCLTELAEMKDVTMDKIRSTILPLLKGNTLLINWFLQLFPKEAPPESSMTDWEEINCDDGEETDDNDKLYETLNLPEVEDPYGGPNCICKCHKIDDEMYRSRNRHCIPCGTKFLQGRVYIQTGKGLRLANVTFNNTSTDHSKRLNIKPFIRQKRKSETSPNKGFMSPPKDDEPRHSNESEDDINVNADISSRKLKSFRANSPSKSRKRNTNSSTPKVRKDAIKSKMKTDVCMTSPNCNRKPKLKIKNIEDNSNESSHEKLDSASPNKEDPTKHEATESETEVGDWDVKPSPGPSIESVDTCEESSQDTIPAQGSESDDSLIEVESVISDNSDDSNDETLTEHENTHSWTRDEDKVILETFQQSGEEQKAFKEIQQRLPDRTISEIRQRFHVLISLLQEMASK